MPRPSTPTLRLLAHFAIALVGFSLVFVLNGLSRKTPYGGLAHQAWLLPATLVMALPLATGWALLMAWGSRRAEGRPRLRTGLLLAVAATCVSLAVYGLVVPRTNARAVALVLEQRGVSPRVGPQLSPRCQTWSELRDTAAAGASRTASSLHLARLARFEMAKRASIPAAALALALVSLSLSALRWRWGMLAATGVVIVVAAAWSAAYDVASDGVSAGTLAPALAAWIPNLAVLLLAGLVVLTLRRAWPVRGVVASAT